MFTTLILSVFFETLSPCAAVELLYCYILDEHPPLNPSYPLYLDLHMLSLFCIGIHKGIKVKHMYLLPSTHSLNTLKTQ